MLESILAEISSIDGEIVLVIDNAESLIIEEQHNFAMLVSMMLTRISQLKILMTSQRPLHTLDDDLKARTLHTREFKEECIVLNSLSKIQSCNLFKDVMARKIDQNEINTLLKTQPDFSKYPQEKNH